MFDLAEIFLPKAPPELLFNITHGMFVMFYTNYKTFQVKQMEKFVVENTTTHRFTGQTDCMYCKWTLWVCNNWIVTGQSACE